MSVPDIFTPLGSEVLDNTDLTFAGGLDDIPDEAEYAHIQMNGGDVRYLDGVDAREKLTIDITDGTLLIDGKDIWYAATLSRLRFIRAADAAAQKLIVRYYKEGL